MNISRTGMLITDGPECACGTVFPFELALPGEPDMLFGTAEVVRRLQSDQTGAPLLGVRFRTFSGEDESRLISYLEEATRHRG